MNLQTKRNIPIPVIIILLKHIRHPLETNTSLYKQIEAHRPFLPSIIRPEQQRDEVRAQSIAKRNERFSELIERNVARSIDIESVEEVPPCSEEGPKAAEFVKRDCAVAVGIEHSDHHADCVWVEAREVAVD